MCIYQIKRKITKDDNPNNRKKILVSSDHLAYLIGYNYTLFSKKFYF